jgi:hypothetical protein
MNPVLKKLLFKGQSPVLVSQAPPEFKGTAAAFGVPVHAAPEGRYGFVLAFAKSAAELEKTAKAVRKVLGEDRPVFWVAYPKGTSKKYKAEIHRDTAHALMGGLGFEGVSMVAIDDDWSAMRFKPKG